jgi:hypothetical protein
VSRRTPGRGGRKYLSQIWHAEPYVRRFDHERDFDITGLIEGLDALFQHDPDAFWKLESSAWIARDRKTCLAVGDVLCRNRALSPKTAARYWRALLQAGRSGEALDVLLHRKYARPQLWAYWGDLAEALARTGRLAQALDAARRAIALEPSAADSLRRARQLEDAIAFEARGPRGVSWEKAAATLAFFDEIGLKDRGAALLGDVLLQGAVTQANRAEAMDLVERLLAGASAEASVRLLKALPAIYAAESERTQVKAAIRSLRGKDDPGPDGSPAGDRDLEYALALACSEAGAWPAAIRRLGRLSLDHKKDQSVRNTLARCVGQYLLEQQPLAFSPGGGGRIFNVVPFNNELFLLRLRLEEMADWVDRFVIVEARFTFTGLPKPLIFDAAKAEFAAFADKIIHVVVDEAPPFVDSPWGRDFYQRDIGLRALSRICGEEDLVLLTDADEIVRREAIAGFDDEFANLRMDTFRYFFNNRLATDREGQRGTGAIWKARHLARHGSSYARFVLSSYDQTRHIHDAGWHFTSIFEPALLADKIRSFAHQEYAHRDESYFQQVIAELRAGQREKGWEPVALDASFPAYLRQNRERLAPFFLDPAQA